MLWKLLARPLLFRFDAERAHHFAMSTYACTASLAPVGSILGSIYEVSDSRLEVDCLGLSFPNPIGLAAGFDKNAQWFNALSRLGFGSIEIGTVTRHGQSGNPKPRLFRLPEDRALVNRLGFNNEGSKSVAARLERTRIRPILGVNIGMTKVTPLDQADEDYLASFSELYQHADYFTVNVSSPNTPGLRSLQDREPLDRLLGVLTERNRELAKADGRPPKPILLKIAPDLTHEAIDDVISIAKERKLDGLIATNTTIGRDGLNAPESEVTRLGAGGMSGAPLTEKSRAIVSYIYRKIDGAMPIIGVGGLMNGDDVWEMMCAGASLVQVYTGFVYGGPGTIRDMLKTLRRRLDQESIDSISKIVGRSAV